MGLVERVIKYVSIAFLGMVYGFVAYYFKLFPYEFFNDALTEAANYTQNENAYTTHWLQPITRDNYGAHSYNEAAIQPGLTLLTSYWADMDWRSGIKLIDEHGNTVHSWNTDIVKLWPDAPAYLGPLNPYVHGSYLFPNGDVVFNIEQTGLFMIDSCGKVKWHLDKTTHHSVARDDDGNFWIPSNVKWEPGDFRKNGLAKAFPGLQPRDGQPVWEDHLLKVSPEGEVLVDISVMKVIYDNNLQRYIPKISKRRNGDVLHLNDIDVLHADQAEQYPLFTAGDLAVSLRHLHMVLVMDPETRKVKWYDTDPWIEQHDPDFTGGGWIEVFDNNREFNNVGGEKRGAMLGGSRIVAIQPHTGKVRIVYPKNDSQFFYSEMGGKLQQLDNGNLLITENHAGRVFEIDPAGDLVWEWVNPPYDKKRVAEIAEGTRYPITTEQVSQWACNKPD